MTKAPARIARLANEIADHAETLAPKDDRLRALLDEMRQLAVVLPARPTLVAGHESEQEDDLEEMFNNVPI
ncbi:hypothetical protein ACFQXB_03660 [Plastorhodobacter daqingensis]|uniref:Terminase small subunit n=1 Tax=Plastorhodobacter daqingensis TaxID=1387281 RepID=A0ABW2UIR0_9RHOB